MNTAIVAGTAACAVGFGAVISQGCVGSAVPGDLVTAYCLIPGPLAYFTHHGT